MKKVLFVMVALLLLASLTDAQIVTKEFYYRVPVAQNATDTIPGTQTGGPGAGGTGWIYVGTDGVEYTMTSQDSVLLYVTFDYADTGYAAATGTSAKVVGHRTRTRVIGEDSLVGNANTANPQAMISGVLRDRSVGVNDIEGGRWIRARIFGINSADFAGSAAGKTVTLRIRTFKYAGQ